MVTAPRRISLLTLTHHAHTLCLPFKHDRDLLALARDAVLRTNTFFWPRHAPSLTPPTAQIRHLELDLAIAIAGGDVSDPRSLDLPTADVAKIVALPYLFPKLATLVVNVDNTASVTAGAVFVDAFGARLPAAAFVEGVAMERCWKVAEVLERVKGLRFPRWRRGGRAERRVVFVQARGSGCRVLSPDPTAIREQEAYARAVYGMLDWPVATVVL